MCEPTTIIAVAGLALSAAQSVSSYQQQRSTAKARRETQRRQARELRRQHALEQSSRIAQLAQDKAAASLKLQKLDRQRLGERATAVVSSLETGAGPAAARDVENRFASLSEEARFGHRSAAEDVALQNARAQQALITQLAGFQPVRGADTVGLVAGLGEAALKYGPEIRDSLAEPTPPDAPKAAKRSSTS